MKQSSVWLCGVIACGVAIGMPLSSGAKDRDEKEKGDKKISAVSDVPTNLPLKKVALFSSGVGYFSREGRVNGGEVTLALSPGQVNDVLKSLVLFDAAGGVKPITYSIADFVNGRPLATDLQLPANLSLGGVLQNFQGAQVRLETSKGTIEGRILSVSTKSIRAKEGDAEQVETLNLVTLAGLRSVSLEDVTQIKLLDEALDAKLRASLERTATGLTRAVDDGKRPVRLHFGSGDLREVRAGYLQEMPVWKTSYRLVLDEKGRPFLQGWGQIENTTDEDWQNVKLSLISGRPISFIQDLYQPLYIPRPVVAPQVIGSPLPQTYGATLTDDERSGQRVTALENRPTALENRVPAPPKQTLSQGLLNRGGFSNSGGFGGNRGDFQRDAPQDALQQRGDMAASAEELAKSAAAQAQGGERGELFEYAIEQPISVPHGQAAMVPIVSEAVGGEAVDIYDAANNAKYAMNGLRFVNTSGLQLAGGPITVYRDGNYAGDGQILDVAPNEARLISYAVDLDMVVGQKTPQVNANRLTLAIRGGVLTITRRQRTTQIYTFRNKASRDKTVIVQQNMDAQAKLITPEKPFETSPNQYRFKLVATAGKTSELAVVTERPISETVALLGADVDLLVAYSQETSVSPALKSALGELVKRRRALTTLQTQRAGFETEIKEITEEQERIRGNMGQLDRNSALYKEYVAKLTAQEDRIEKVRAEIARLRTAEAAAQADLRAYIDGLNLGDQDEKAAPPNAPTAMEAPVRAATGGFGF